MRSSPIAVNASDVETAAGSLIPSLSFTVNGGGTQAGLPSGLSLSPTSTAGVWQLAGNIAEPGGGYVITITFTDADGGSASTFASLIVLREDANLVISGPTAVAVDPATGRSPAFTLIANISEAPDGAPGNITNAVPVTFQLTPVGSTTPSYNCTAPVMQPATSLASCTFTNVNVDVYDVTTTIGGSFYQGSKRSVVAVYDTSLGFVTGTGSISRSVDGQAFSADFSVNLKYLANGQLQGAFAYVENRGSGAVRFQATSIGSLAFVGNEARINGSGTINGSGNYLFVARLADNGEPGRNDTIGLRVTSTDGTVVADLTFDPVRLANGNIKVH
jgi:hypothetical protein